MKTAFDFPDSEFDDQERKFLEEIRANGWFSTRVFDPEREEPDFSYSTGIFTGTGFPEIIVFSLPKQVSHDILWDIYHDLSAGTAFPISTKIKGIFGNHDAVFLPVSRKKYCNYLGWSRWFYDGDAFPCLQLIWPDPYGSFPWESNFETKFGSDQPDLTENGWTDLKIRP